MKNKIKKVGFVILWIVAIPFLTLYGIGAYMFFAIAWLWSCVTGYPFHANKGISTGYKP